MQLSSFFDEMIPYERWALQMENAWVFAHEDVLADTVKAYSKFEENLKEKLPKQERKQV